MESGVSMYTLTRQAERWNRLNRAGWLVGSDFFFSEKRSKNGSVGRYSEYEFIERQAPLPNCGFGSCVVM